MVGSTYIQDGAVYLHIFLIGLFVQNKHLHDKMFQTKLGLFSQSKMMQGITFQ